MGRMNQPYGSVMRMPVSRRHRLFIQLYDHDNRMQKKMKGEIK